MREMLRTLCQWKGVEIIEGEICSDHVYLLLSIPPQNESFGVYGLPKGEKQLDDISEIWEHEICIPKPQILV